MFKKFNVSLFVISRKNLILRRLSQLLSIFLVFFLLKKTYQYPLPEKLPLSIYFKIDGLLGMASAIINNVFVEFFLPAFIMILLIVFAGNFFCFWVCPVGGCIDWLNLITFRKFWRISLPLPKKLRLAGVWILLFVIISALFSRLYNLAFLGFIFDPFVILYQALIKTNFWVIFLSLIIISSILYPRLWCNCFCPLGRLYSIAGNIKTKIKRKR